MNPKRIIINTENCDNIPLMLCRLKNNLTEYYKHRPQDGNRVTVRLDKNGAMFIYHKMKDLAIFTLKNTPPEDYFQSDTPIKPKD